MATPVSPAVDIIDIRARNAPLPGATSVREQLVAGLSKPEGHKSVPTLLLYDEHGLRLYDKITTDVPEYYLFPAEEQILRDNADDIVRLMHAGNGTYFGHETLVELGAG